MRPKAYTLCLQTAFQLCFDILGFFKPHLRKLPLVTFVLAQLLPLHPTIQTTSTAARLLCTVAAGCCAQQLQQKMRIVL